VLTSKSRVKWITKYMNLIDLLAILPYYLELLLENVTGIGALVFIRILRLFRIFRLLKMAKYSKLVPVLTRTSRAAASSFVLGIIFLGIACVIWASLIYYSETLLCEFDTADGLWKYADGTVTAYQSVPDSMWWALVTMATVGYGDMVPITPWGKLIAGLAMICGPFVLSYPMTVLSDTYRVVTINYNVRQKLSQQRKSLFIEEKILGQEARTPKFLLLSIRQELSQFQRKINEAKIQLESLEKQYIEMEINVQRLWKYTKRLEYVKKKVKISKSKKGK